MNIVSKRGLLGNYSYTLNMGVMRDQYLPESGNPGIFPGKIGFVWAPDGTPATERYLVSDSVVPVDSWTNVTVVYDGSDVRMYLNGNPSNSTAYTGGLYAGSTDLFIGYTADESSYFFDGTIDEVKISRTFPHYDVTIKAFCYVGGTYVNVPITLDGAPSGFTTPHTFTKTGTHTFAVPIVDSQGHLFYEWNNGLTSTTIVVSAGGNYTAYYGTPIVIPVPGDVDGDGDVDGSDLYLFNLAYGSKLGDSNWNLDCDFNIDDRVDALDLFQLSKNYGTT